MQGTLEQVFDLIDYVKLIHHDTLYRIVVYFYCIGNKNKPPAMQVCSQTALASSKKSPCYNEYKVRQPNHYNKEESKWTIIVYHTQNGHANII